MGSNQNMKNYNYQQNNQNMYNNNWQRNSQSLNSNSWQQGQGNNQNMYKNNNYQQNNQNMYNNNWMDNSYLQPKADNYNSNNNAGDNVSSGYGRWQKQGRCVGGRQMYKRFCQQPGQCNPAVRTT